MDQMEETKMTTTTVMSQAPRDNDVMTQVNPRYPQEIHRLFQNAMMLETRDLPTSGTGWYCVTRSTSMGELEDAEDATTWRREGTYTAESVESASGGCLCRMLTTVLHGR